jgi:DNA-binding ferritin-like protein
MGIRTQNAYNVSEVTTMDFPFSTGDYQGSDEPGPAPEMILKELLAGNRTLIAQLRSAHTVCALADDYASTAMIEVWIAEAERHAWFLFEATR